MIAGADTLGVERAVNLGSSILRQGRSHLGALIAKGDRDFATAVNLQAEDAVKAALHDLTPDVPFLGEEHLGAGARHRPDLGPGPDRRHRQLLARQPALRDFARAPAGRAPAGSRSWTFRSSASATWRSKARERTSTDGPSTVPRRRRCGRRSSGSATSRSGTTRRPRTRCTSRSSPGSPRPPCASASTARRRSTSPGRRADVSARR